MPIIGDIGNGGDVVTITGGAGALLMAIRYLYKMFRSDVRESKGDDSRDEVLDRYKEMADRYQAEAAENAKRADLFAAERNKAIEELGKIRGEVVVLTRQVEYLQQQIEQLTQIINQLSTSSKQSQSGVGPHALATPQPQGDDHA